MLALNVQCQGLYITLRLPLIDSQLTFHWHLINTQLTFHQHPLVKIKLVLVDSRQQLTNFRLMHMHVSQSTLSQRLSVD